MGYPQMLKDIFPNVRVQWCLFHLNKLVVKDFESEKKLNRYGKKVLPLQEMYNLYMILNLFLNIRLSAVFLSNN